MEQLTLSLGELHAKDSVKLDDEEGYPTPEAHWPCTLSGLCQSVSRNGSFGKMSPELCPLTEDGTSGRSSGRWTNAGITLRGECLTLNFSERPNVVVESTLSGILEVGKVPQRYFLSQRACAGIAKREGRRGKLTLVSRETGHRLSTTERLSVWRKAAQGD